MNKTTAFLLIVITALVFTVGVSKQSKAQQDKSFAGVLTFVTSNDRVGFFDQNTGKIYVYDNNLTQCLFIGQLQTLGKPIQALMSNPASTTNQ